MKARKEVAADEERLRSEFEAEAEREFAALRTREEVELGATKMRLISRLTSNLEDLRASSSRALQAADEALSAVFSGVSSLCTSLASDGIVDNELLSRLDRQRRPDEVGPAIAELGSLIAVRLRENETTARTAEREMAVMAETLRKTKEQLCAAEAIIATRHVRTTTEHLSAAELFRQQGQQFEARMMRLEEEQHSAINHLIRESALPKYHLHAAAAQRSCLDPIPAEQLAERFLTQKERTLVAQSKLLADVQAEIQRMTREHIATLGDRLRTERTNLPAHVRGELAACTCEELCRLIDYVSFEPQVSEAISAFVDHRKQSESASMNPLTRAPHDALTHASVAAHFPVALGILPPRPPMLASSSASVLDPITPGFGTLRPHPPPRKR